MHENSVSLGYYVTKAVVNAQQGQGLVSLLLPDIFVTTTECFAEFLPDVDLLNENTKDPEVAEEDDYLGISGSECRALCRYFLDHPDRGYTWPNVYDTVEAGRVLLQNFVANREGLLLLGMGVSTELLDDYLKHAGDPKSSVDYSVASRRTRIEGGGDLIGYDVRCIDLGLSCSWICNGLERDVHDRLGVLPNERGLLTEFSDAKWCADYANRPDVGAEPGYWAPISVTQYAIDDAD